MSTHTSKRNRDVALGTFKDYGFSLEEPDDHVLWLYFKDKLIATFNQTWVTEAIIQEGCRNFLVNKLNQDYHDIYSEELNQSS